MKIGLYSITYLGIWYKGGALSLVDFIKKAKKLGLLGVEIDGKRPHGHPLDFSAKARAEIKAITEGEGLDMIGLAANNDFMSPVDEHREAQLMMVAEQIKLCKDLGGKVMRLFLGWPGVTEWTASPATSTLEPAGPSAPTTPLATRCGTTPERASERSPRSPRTRASSSRSRTTRRSSGTIATSSR